MSFQKAVAYVHSLFSPEAAASTAFDEAMSSYTPTAVTPTLSHKQLRGLFDDWWAVVSKKPEGQRGMTLPELSCFVADEKEKRVESTVMAALFGIFDEDHDGMLSFREFCSASSLFMAYKKADRLKLQFRVWDKNHKGFLSQEDLADALIWGMPKFIRSALQSAVKSGKEEFSYADFVEILEGIEFEHYCFQVLRRLDRVSLSLKDINEPISFEIGALVPLPSLPGPAEIVAFFNAIKERDLEYVKEKAGERPEMPGQIHNSRGYTPMHHAAELGYVDMLTALLPDQRPGESTYGSVNTRSAQLIVCLVSVRTKADNRTPLMVAAAANQDEAARFLVDMGADLSATDSNQLTPAQIASSNGHFELATYLQERQGSSSMGDVSRWLGKMSRSPTLAPIAGGSKRSTDGDFAL